MATLVPVFTVFFFFLQEFYLFILKDLFRGILHAFIIVSVRWTRTQPLSVHGAYTLLAVVR